MSTEPKYPDAVVDITIRPPAPRWPASPADVAPDDDARRVAILMRRAYRALSASMAGTFAEERGPYELDVDDFIAELDAFITEATDVDAEAGLTTLEHVLLTITRWCTVERGAGR